jgi:hypothetical protein
VPTSLPADDPFVRLAQNLGELEVVIGEPARPAVAEVRARLNEAIGCRVRGDIAGSLAAIRAAMERLAVLGTSLDSEEGAMMRFIAARFSEALGNDAKGEAKGIVSVMRQKAGDNSKDGDDW